MRTAIALLVCAASALAQNALTARFSNPSAPRTVQVTTHTGNIVVRAGTGSEVTVTPQWRGTLPPGDRGVEIRERDNFIEITASKEARFVNLDVQVPEGCSLRLKAINGDIEVGAGAAEVDVDSVNGNIRITNPSGGVVAHSVNGPITATFARAPAKPLSFSTVNGQIDVTIPADTRAKLRLKSQNGAILTDFDVALEPGATAQQTGDGWRRLRSDRNIYGTVNGGGTDIAATTLNSPIRIRKGS